VLGRVEDDQSSALPLLRQLRQTTGMRTCLLLLFPPHSLRLYPTLAARLVRLPSTSRTRSRVHVGLCQLESRTRSAESERRGLYSGA